MGKKLVMAVLAVCAACGLWFAHGLSQAVEAARDSARLGYACQVKQAIGNYIGVDKKFPPRYSIVAPSIGRTHFSASIALYDYSDAYKLNEPWDAPDNLKFAAASTPYSRDEFALYVTPNDLPTVLADEQSRAPEEIDDGMADTLLVASVRDSEILWTDPRDLSWEWFKSHSAADAGRVGFPHQYLLFADLAIYEVLQPLSEADFRALWTRAGQESTSRAELVAAGYLRRCGTSSRIEDFLTQP